MHEAEELDGRQSVARQRADIRIDDLDIGLAVEVPLSGYNP